MEKLREYDCKCYYCRSSILDIQDLINDKKLKYRKCGRGGNGKRGMVLEIERKNNDKDYSSTNCELVCYLCNNDKSSIVDEVSYKNIIAVSRRKYISYLKKKMD